MVVEFTTPSRSRLLSSMYSSLIKVCTSCLGRILRLTNLHLLISSHLVENTRRLHVKPVFQLSGKILVRYLNDLFIVRSKPVSREDQPTYIRSYAMVKKNDKLFLEVAWPMGNSGKNSKRHCY